MSTESNYPIPAIFQRVSKRKFTKQPIASEMVEQLLLAGTRAPSSGNMQPWEFIVIDDPAKKQEIVKSTFSGYFSKGMNYQYWIADAAVVIVACSNVKRTVARYGPAGREWALIDSAAAVQNILLTATALGLSGCWVGGINEQDIKESLHIPDDVRIIGLVPIGYSEEKALPKSRLPLKWVTHRNEYNVPYYD
ncbi:nitroreductase family protein [Brevibacillus choshinensis]|uniref:nitroreductase family protein n=1 Tax=Brevibacillus choshinensis TaxID=54911 RepID=UPI002E249926|nr:nitroreductase family protein [Brevibacillus choshinensis]